jgi:hypothetical protein
MNIKQKINDFKTKYEEGFTESEVDLLLKDFPNINKEKFYAALNGTTGIVKNNEHLIYHCDIKKALICGLENRDLYIYEWD